MIGFGLVGVPGLARLVAEALGLSLVAYLLLDRAMGKRRNRRRKRRSSASNRAIAALHHTPPTLGPGDQADSNAVAAATSPSGCEFARPEDDGASFSASSPAAVAPTSDEEAREKGEKGEEEEAKGAEENLGNKALHGGDEETTTAQAERRCSSSQVERGDDEGLGTEVGQVRGSSPRSRQAAAPLDDDKLKSSTIAVDDDDHQIDNGVRGGDISATESADEEPERGVVMLENGLVPSSPSSPSIGEVRKEEVVEEFNAAEAVVVHAERIPDDDNLSPLSPEERQELEESRRMLEERGAAAAAATAEAAALREAARASARRTEEAEARMRAAREELHRERSRAEMLRMELANQDSIWTVKTEQKDESLKTAREDLDRCQAELCAQREAFQKSYAQLRATLEEREAALKEKEDSNYLLRKDLLEVMTQFNQEKMAMEKRAQEQRARGQEMERALAEKAEEIARLECELGSTKERAERRGKEKKKLTKEVGKLRKELEEVYKHNERGIRVSKILDHIDSID